MWRWQERIRRTHWKSRKKIKTKRNWKIRYRFRVFKLDDTNMTDVYYNHFRIQSGFTFSARSNDRDLTRTTTLLLFGYACLSGDFLYHFRITQNRLKDTVHNYNEEFDLIIACFDEDIRPVSLRRLLKQPLRAVFRDEVLRIVFKINVWRNFQTLSTWYKVKLFKAGMAMSGKVGKLHTLNNYRTSTWNYSLSMDNTNVCINVFLRDGNVLEAFSQSGMAELWCGITGNIETFI